MPRVNSKEFLSSNNYKSGGNKSDWKKDGKTIGWIHPGLFLCQRFVHGWLPALEQSQSDGREYIRVRKFVCAKDKCVVCDLQRWATKKISDGAQPSDVIIAMDKSGLDLENLSGVKKGQNSISAREEVVIPWISRDGRDPEHPVQIIYGTTAIAIGLRNLINSMVEDYGEERGNPEFNPYPFKLSYDKDQKNPNNKYRVERVGNDLAPSTDEVRAIFKMTGQELGIDMNRFDQVTPRADILAGLESGWANRNYPFDEFLAFLGEKRDPKPEPKPTEQPKEAPAVVVQSEDEIDKKIRLLQEEKAKREKEAKPKEEPRSFPPLSTPKVTQYVDKPKVELTNHDGVKCDECGGQLTKMGRCVQCGKLCADDDVPF